MEMLDFMVLTGCAAGRCSVSGHCRILQGHNCALWPRV